MNHASPGPEGPVPDAEPARRIFFGLWPSPEDAVQIMQWAQDAHALCGGRIMRADTLHVTLAFLGSTPQSKVQALVKASRDWRAEVGSVQLNHFGRFAGPRIVWAGPSLSDDERTEWLDRLYSQLWSHLEGLGWSRPSGIYRPHVSLLRKASPCDLSALHRAPFAWAPAGCVLVASTPGPTGSHYEVLARMSMRHVAG